MLIMLGWYVPNQNVALQDIHIRYEVDELYRKSVTFGLTVDKGH